MKKNYTVYYKTEYRGVSNKINFGEKRDLAEAFYFGLQKSLKCSNYKMLEYDTTVEKAFSTKEKLKPLYEQVKEVKRKKKRKDYDSVHNFEEGLEQEGEGDWIVLTFKSILADPWKRKTRWKTSALARYCALGYTIIDKEAGGVSTQAFSFHERELESELVMYVTIKSLIQKNWGLVEIKKSERKKWKNPFDR